MLGSAHILPQELLRRFRLQTVDSGHDLMLPEEAADFVRQEVVAVHPPSEYLGAVFVDDRMRALATTVPYLGYLRRGQVEPRVFLAPGAILEATGLLLFHHCPGQEAKARRHDVQLAKLMIRAGEATGLAVLDFLVLGGDGWISLRRLGRVRFPPFDGEQNPDGRARVKPKYRDPECPERTWSGRGKMALWLRERIEAGARLEDFEVGER